MNIVADKIVVLSANSAGSWHVAAASWRRNATAVVQPNQNTPNHPTKQPKPHN